ncbi:stalk domain-containing protein [Paenibacillus sp. D51F]
MKLDARTVIENGRVYVPLRFVSQAFGYKVT